MISTDSCQAKCKSTTSLFVLDVILAVALNKSSCCFNGGSKSKYPPITEENIIGYNFYLAAELITTLTYK
jgi:hypothetical protein